MLNLLSPSLSLSPTPRCCRGLSAPFCIRPRVLVACRNRAVVRVLSSAVPCRELRLGAWPVERDCQYRYFRRNSWMTAETNLLLGLLLVVHKDHRSGRKDRSSQEGEFRRAGHGFRWVTLEQLGFFAIMSWVANSLDVEKFCRQSPPIHSSSDVIPRCCGRQATDRPIKRLARTRVELQLPKLQASGCACCPTSDCACFRSLLQRRQASRRNRNCG